MNKLTLLTVALMIAAASLAPGTAAAQKKTKTPPQTRDVTIYVYQRSAESSHGQIVPVSRRVAAAAADDLLNRALELLLKGANEEEEKRDLADFIFGLKFVSARVRNKTAQINFKFTDPDIAEESWEGGGFDRQNFVKAVELTARQFPGVERVSFCISGYREYQFFSSLKEDKCPFPTFPRPSSLRRKK